MPMINPLPGSGKSLSKASGPRGMKASGLSDPTNERSVPKEEASSSMMEKDSGQAVGPKFKKTLEAVTKANKRARIKNDPADDTAQSNVPANGLLVDLQESAKKLAALGFGPLLAVQVPTDVSGESPSPDQASQSQLQQASQIIQAAIAKISQTLNIKINTGLGNLQLNNPSQNVINQFAEIVNALKGITGLLDEAVKNGMPVEISGTAFDLNQAGQAQQTLGTETFQIQMALEMAGLSGDIATVAAQKNGTAIGNGIITALDPSLLSMPASQTKQVFGDALQAKGEDVAKLFAQLAEKLSATTGSDGAQIKNKLAAIAAGVGAKNVSAATGTAAPSAKKPSDENALDSKVMRTLLKIDSSETSNVSAAENDGKIDLSKTVKLLLAKDLGAASPISEDASKSVFSGVDLTKDAAVPPEGIADARSPALPKTIEESVMNQLNDKVQTALKTGVTEIRLLLRPEALGEMRVKLTMDGDVVMGKIYVENQQVKHIVENNLQSLKDSLAEHNLHAGSFDVNVGGDAREHMRDLARSLVQDGPAKVGAVAEKAESDPNDAHGANGRETGRRFGTNTIEYFV
jgi:flagellar hook-length control protein FliK